MWGSRRAISLRSSLGRLITGYYALAGTQNPEVFTETELRKWGGDDWAESEAGLVAFEIFRQAINKMKTKYPFVTLYVVRGTGPPPNPEYVELPETVFQTYTHVELGPKFRFQAHGAFRRDDSRDYTAYLFDLGRGDFFDFKGFTRELSWFGLAFLLADEARSLESPRSAVARAETGGELSDLLLRDHEVLFFPDEEPDWVLLTRDREVVRGILRGSSFQR